MTAPAHFTATSIIAEEKIKAAIKDGLFDNLPGAGKPLTLEDDSHIPEELRMARKILKNSGYISEDSEESWQEDRQESQNLAGLMRRAGKDEARENRRLLRYNLFMGKVKRKQKNKFNRGFSPCPDADFGAGPSPLRVAMDNSPYLEKILKKL